MFSTLSICSLLSTLLLKKQTMPTKKAIRMKIFKKGCMKDKAELEQSLTL